MAGYAIIDTSEVTDRAVFDDVIERAPAVIRACGGKYLVRDGAMESVQGDWSPTRIAVLEFESVAQARAWQDSPDYAELKQMLKNSSNTSVILIEGV